MAALSASVLWCGVAGVVSYDSAANSSSEVLAQEAREFGCSACNIMELIIAGSYRMVTEAQAKTLQWTDARRRLVIQCGGVCSTAWADAHAAARGT